MSHTPEPWIVGHETRIYMGGAVEEREIAVATKADVSERYHAPANAARIVACVNGCRGLNPAAYRECVEALHICLEWILLGNHNEAPGWIEARDTAQAALAHAKEQG